MQNNTQIYEQLILPFGEDVSMSLQEDFPASRSVLQGKERERKTTATYGRKCLEQFGKFTHVGYWAKMFSELLVGRMGWYSSRCVLTWKLKGTKYNRLYFQLAVSMLPTKGTGYGLLPTVQTQGLKICNEKGKTVFMPLGLLPTPKVQDCRHALRDRGRSNLGEEMSELAYRQTGDTSRLNPLFVAEMMGFPPDWTVLPFQNGEMKV